MPLSVVCDSCHAKLKAPNAGAGRRLKCPKCSTLIHVPPLEVPIEDIVVLDDSDVIGGADLDDSEFGGASLGSDPFDFGAAGLPSVGSSSDQADGFGGLDDLGDFDDGLPSFDAPDAAPASTFADLTVPGIAANSSEPGRLPGTNLPGHHLPGIAASANQSDKPKAKPEAGDGDTHSELTTPVLVGALAAGLFVVIGLGVGAWYLISGDSKSGSSAATSIASGNGNGSVSGEMPWDVADAKRAERLGLISDPSQGETKLVDSETSSTPGPNTVSSTNEPLKETTTSGAEKPTSVAVQENLSPGEVIARIKATTVFIKVTTSEGEQTGSGFLVEKDARRGRIVTNAHVVTAEGESIRSIECILHSGMKTQKVYNATVQGKDDDNDLAILSISHKGELPNVVDWTNEVELQETSTVLAAGFPFGEILKTNQRSPSITISRGTVSSIRRDDSNQVSLLQIDGGIHPGNSGGPVLTEQGQLVGIAVAKLRNTEIGFAIPRRILQSVLRGRVSKVSVIQQSAGPAGRSLQFFVVLVDPAQQIDSVQLLVFKADKQTTKKADPDGSWQRVATDVVEEVSVSYDNRQAKGSCLVTTDHDNLMFQVAWTSKDSKMRFSEPIAVEEFDTGNLMASKSLGQSILPDVIQETRVIELPRTMSDFAINFSNGDVACVDSKDHRVYLLESASLNHDSVLKELPSIRVGSRPFGIAFKQFGDKAYYAVVCSQDPHLYVIDAEMFELTKKIPVKGAEVSHLAASRNPKDPFVYYNFGPRGDSEAGAINLRTMKDAGQVFDDSIDCEVSADGKFAYRRGPGSPSGFESLRMTSDFSDDKPVFVRFFYEHRSVGVYLSDPFGRFVAAGTGIYTTGLEKNFATLPFTPVCFFRDHPLIVGVTGTSDPRRGSRSKSPGLVAASCNTFTQSGNVVQFPKDLIGESTPLPRGVGGPADFQRVGLRTRILADDTNQRVIYASNNKIVTVPIKAFGVDPEPFLRLVKTEAEFRVGSARSFTIEASDPSVAVSLGDQPDGIELVETSENGRKLSLRWKPAENDIGDRSIKVTLAYNDIERVEDFDLKVSQPSVRVPIGIAGFEMSPTGTFCVAWSGTGLDKYGRMIHQANGTEPSSELCVVPFRKGIQPIIKTVSFNVKQVVMSGPRLVILPMNNNQQVHVFNVQTLEREKLILPTSPLQSIRLDGGELMLEGSSSTDVYNLKTLRRLRSIDGNFNRNRAGSTIRQNTATLLDGILRDGALHDIKDDSVKLILAPGRIRQFPGAQGNLMSGQFLRKFASANSGNSQHSSGTAKIVAGPLPIPDANVQVSLENRIQTVRVPGNSHTRRITQDVTLLVVEEDGVLTRRVPMVRQTSVDTNSAARPLMQISDGNVMIACGNRIYRWTPSRVPGRQAAAERAEVKVGLHFKPKQSSLAFSSSSETLAHELGGGESPFDYFLMTRLEGVTIDDQSGEVKIERDALLLSAAQTLRSIVNGASDPSEISHRLKSSSIEMIAEFKEFTNRKPRGFPMAVPIHLKASDNDGNVAEIQYFVLVDLPIADLANQLARGVSR